VQATVALGRSGNVVRRPSTAFATKRDVGIRRRGNLSRIALDRSGAGWATQGRSATVIADEEQCLGGVVRIRTWLAHEGSSYLDAALHGWALHSWTFDGTR
jgi:hypothetical protein